MSWCYLSDTANEDLWSLSDSAHRLYVAGLVECNRSLSDGYVPISRLPALMPGYKQEISDELVRAGYWRLTADGYQVVHYLRDDGGWQYSREEVEKHRADARKRQAAHRGRLNLRQANHVRPSRVTSRVVSLGNTDTNTNTDRSSLRDSLKPSDPPKSDFGERVRAWNEAHPHDPVPFPGEGTRA